MRVIQSLNELLKFGEAHKHINVYGAGVYANKILNLATKKKKFQIDAFLVNDLSVNPNTLENIPVKLATDPKIPRDKSVLISLGVDMRDEVLSYLEKEGYTDLTVITELVRYELSDGMSFSLLNIAKDKLISKGRTYNNNTPPQKSYNSTKTFIDKTSKRFLTINICGKKHFRLFKIETIRKLLEYQ